MRLVRVLGSPSGLVLLAALVFAQANLGKIRLTGTVKAQDGRPLAGAKVVIRFIESDRITGRISPAPTSTPQYATFETSTNKKGIWSYAGLAAGTWEISASLEGYHSSRRRCKILQLAESPRVELVLEKLPEGGSETILPGLLERADELAFRKDYDGAIALYRQYLDQDPEAVMVFYAVGDCLLEKGELQAAIAQYQEFFDKTSPDPRNKALTARALARIGECHMKAGDKAKAAAYWRSSLVMSPLDAEVPFDLAEVLFSERKLEEAGQYYRVAAELSPGWADPHYKLGLVYMAQGDFAKARSAFRKLLEVDPGSALAAQAREMLKELDRIKKAC